MSTGNAHNGAMLSATACEIETYSGRFVDLYDPDPATIALEDIAQALSLTCRYGGHVKRFYSVAEHVVLVHDLMEHERNQLGLLQAALLHDAAEAFLGDVVSPLKYAQRCAEFDYPGAIHRASMVGDFTGAYKNLTTRMERAIAVRFGVDADAFDHHDVQVVDMWALRIEAAELTHSGGANWRWEGELPNDGELPARVRWAAGDPPATAQAMFMARAKVLGIE